MNKTRFITLIALSISTIAIGQTAVPAGAAKNQYLQEQRTFSKKIFAGIYEDFAAFNGQPEAAFTAQVDSLRKIYTDHLGRYAAQLDSTTIREEEIGIRYFFDKLLLEYPLHHKSYTGNSTQLSPANQARLDRHRKDFNDPAMLEHKDFKDYIEAKLYFDTWTILREDSSYVGTDNQELTVHWKLISKYFNNPQVREYWRYQYLFDHIDNLGIKNIENFYQDFIKNAKGPEYRQTIRELYENHRIANGNHRIRTYKKTGDLELDIHLFMPDTAKYSGNYPVMLYFHGGSWSEGKPDWFFETAKYYARQGWIGAAVEYRISDRHNTLPFEAVKDAKSAVRWLRQNARELRLNPDHIVATGNSAGGHLALATVLADKVNESTDSLAISPFPNVLLVNSGVFDLTLDNAKWIVKDLENKDEVKLISPNHLLTVGLPPTLIIHGENDGACPLPTAKYFVKEMQALGNPVEFHAIKGAGHFLWYGKHSDEVSKIRIRYIDALGFAANKK